MLTNLSKRGKEITREHRDEIFWCAAISLFGLLAFGLGAMAKVSSLRYPIRIEASDELSQHTGIIGKADEGRNREENRVFVGSRQSKKYHFPWCPGAEKIAEKNKIWFESKEDAIKAGYLPSKNCKGLQ